jgi:8-oxo-dGTP pyrophosphatase MutT (NUDIX family)
MSFSYTDALKEITWKDGKVFERLVVGSYRHAVTIVCSGTGRNKAMFANGEYPYFAYAELMSSKGDWIRQGNNVVPVLPDRRLLMVVEQRPPQSRYETKKDFIKNDKVVSLPGPYGSLEFPGGAMEPGESVTMGFLRELGPETGIPDQTVEVYRRIPPIHPFGADLALEMFIAVVVLQDRNFSDWVENDGGLHVHALTEKDVRKNFWRGSITSGQSGILGWQFYGEVMGMLESPFLYKDMNRDEYISHERDVKLIVPK